jgi:transposase InsO family protein
MYSYEERMRAVRLFVKYDKSCMAVITEFRIPAGKVYLSPIVDCFDGLVVSWTMSTSPNAELANSMLDEAAVKLGPESKFSVI